MNNYYEVTITKTSKQITGVSRDNQEYNIWDRVVKKLSTLEAVIEYLQGGNEYGVDYREWSRSKMYRDNINSSLGEGEHVGYVYASKGYEYDRSTGKLFFYHKDWVEVDRIGALPEIVTI